MFKRRLLSRSDEVLVLEAIQRAESSSTAEVRVHVDRYCKSDPMYKAQNRFVQLEMDQTKQRNGVLLYVALLDHKAAIIGDQGIDARLDQDFWQRTLDAMTSKFSAGEYGKGLADAVDRIGSELARYFPPDPSDTNELSDDISYG